MQPSSDARCLIFGRIFRLLPYFKCANSEGFIETAWMRRLAWAFTGCLCDKYHDLMSWLNWSSMGSQGHKASSQRKWRLIRLCGYAGWSDFFRASHCYFVGSVMLWLNFYVFSHNLSFVARLILSGRIIIYWQPIGRYNRSRQYTWTFQIIRRENSAQTQETRW